MGAPYHDLLASVGVRINALAGTELPVNLETVYATRPLAPANFDSSIFPFSDCLAQMGSAEQKLAQTIAETKDNSARARLTSQTDLLASGALLPSEDENGLSVIGVYGDVFDSTDPVGANEGTVLSEQPLETIRRRLRTSALWKIPVFQYSMLGDSIIHTRPTVRIEVCVYDYLNQQAAMLANDDMLLPDIYGEAIICGAIAMLVRDDEFRAQAGDYATYFTETLAAIRGGETIKARARAA